MTREKILAFLNLDIKKSVDKFSMKLLTWFNVSFGAFVILVSVLFAIEGLIDFSWLDILFVIFSLCSNVLFFISIRFVKKSVYEWFHHVAVSSCTVLTLFHGWLVISKGEFADKGNPRFGWMHIAVLFAALVLAVYILLKFLWVWKLLQNNAVDVAREIVRQKTPISLPIVLGFSPMIFVRVLRGTFESMGLGIGFGMWALMCGWLFFVIILLPRIVVILKYKIHTWTEAP